MIQIQNLRVVKSFIQEQLGCTCPEEVFQDIQYEEIPANREFPHKLQRLLVGRRLLIYIASVESASLVITILPTLVQQGRLERDRNHYNRTRIVLATSDLPQVRTVAELIFSSLPGKDDHIHLHVVTTTVIADVR